MSPLSKWLHALNDAIFIQMILANWMCDFMTIMNTPISEPAQVMIWYDDDKKYDTRKEEQMKSDDLSFDGSWPDRPKLIWILFCNMNIPDKAHSKAWTRRWTLFFSVTVLQSDSLYKCRHNSMVIKILEIRNITDLLVHTLDQASCKSYKE